MKNITALHKVIDDEVLCSAWFPQMYRVNHLLAVYDSMTVIDCARGENKSSDLLPPSSRPRRGRYSKKRIRSKFQAANADTSGVDPSRLSGKKRSNSGAPIDETDAVYSEDDITEIGNFLSGGAPSEISNSYSILGAPDSLFDDSSTSSDVDSPSSDDDASSEADSLNEIDDSNSNTYGSTIYGAFQALSDFFFVNTIIF